MRHRETDPPEEAFHRQVKEQRRDLFDWIGLAITGAPLALKVIALLGLGAGAAVTAPKVYQHFNGGPLPIADGETVIPEELPPELRQSLDSLNAAISKQAEEIEALKQRRRSGDAALEKRVEFLEGQH